MGLQIIEALTKVIHYMGLNTVMDLSTEHAIGAQSVMKAGTEPT